MDDFVQRQNLERFRRLLAETKNETQRERIAKLLAEEEAKDAGQEASES